MSCVRAGEAKLCGCERCVLPNLTLLEPKKRGSSGFRFSSEVDVLIERILEKAEELARELEYADPPRH